MEKRISVDTYFKINKGCGSDEQYTDMNSFCRTLQYDDFELLYGCNDDDALWLNRSQVYYLNKKYPEKIKIIFMCEHKGKKEKYHPDYNKPFEVEVLCRHCRFLRLSKNSRECRDKMRK
jgi:hypothetical protein